MTKSRRPFLILGAGILCISALSGAQALDTRKALPAGAEGWTSAGTDRVYNRETISTYLKDSSEIYLAYDFKTLTVREYRKPNASPIIAEMYEMGRAEDAYGIFSHDRDGEPAAVGYEAIYGGEQLRFWKGRVFVRVFAEKESPGSKIAVFSLAGKIAAILPREGKKPRIAACFPPQGLLLDSLHYFHTFVSLNAYAYLGEENVFGLSEKTEAALAGFDLDGQQVRALLCQYPSAEEAQSAFRNVLTKFFGAPDNKAGTLVKKMDKERFLGSRLTGPIIILIFESPNKKTCEVLLDRIEKKIKEVFS